MLAALPEVVSLGECGLDYDRMFSPKETQIEARKLIFRVNKRKVFNKQLSLARQLEKPLFLHERSASSDFIEIMEQNMDLVPKVSCLHGIYFNRLGLCALFYRYCRRIKEICSDGVLHWNYRLGLRREKVLMPLRFIYPS